MIYINSQFCKAALLSRGVSLAVNGFNAYIYPMNTHLELQDGQFHKMVKRTQIIRRQFADELFECVWRLKG